MLTKHPHIAGKENNKQLIEKIVQHWKEVGLDHATMTPYRVLLSYLDDDHPNYVRLLGADGTAKYTSPLYEDVLRPEDNVSDIIPPFNAYSGRGNVSVGTSILQMQHH